MTAAGRGSALLLTLLQHWQALLQSYNPYAPAILRISSGARYITRARAANIDGVVAQLLGLCQTYLLQPDLAIPESMLRAKLLLEISRPSAGLLLRLRYYGDAPTLDHSAWVRRAMAASAVLLDPVMVDRAVTLGVLLPEPEQQLSLIHVEAAGQLLAVPLAAVAKAVPAAEAVATGLPGQRYALAECLGLVVAQSAPRAACLLVKTPQGLQALQVDALVGHGRDTVMSPGPLFLAQPWCLGFVPREPPVLVLDPWPLLRKVLKTRP